MTDQQFPQNDPIPVRKEIGSKSFVFVFPIEVDAAGNVTDGDPYANYSIQILGGESGIPSHMDVIEVEKGKLFRVGGVDHLTVAAKQAIIAMDEDLETKARTAFIV